LDPQRLAELANIPDPRLTAANTGIFFDTNAPGVTEVLWIRHGHIPESGPADDPHLTPIGIEQAQALGEYLATQKPLTAVYSSPFLRCRDTADAIAGRQSLPVEVMPELREVEVYVPEGVSMREHMGDEAWQAYSERMRRMRTWDARGDLGETSASVRQRSVSAVDQVIERHPGGRIALVSHGPVIVTYFAVLFDSPFDLLYQPRLTSISSVWARADDRRPGAINATPHFGVL
jgi:broad specificity phosphatase PhoE